MWRFRRLVAALFVVAACALWPLSSTTSSLTSATRVVRWSPFDSAGNVKEGLLVRTIRKRADCGTGSEVVGNVGYRCGYGQFIVDPCWRGGVGTSQFVLCPAAPWSRSMLRLRIPKLGQTYGASPSRPWAMELTNGDRCLHYKGAYAAPAGEPQVEYHCESGIDLLMDLRRDTPLWTIGSARYVKKKNRSIVLPRVAVRTAFIGALPRELARQHELASRAADYAVRTMRRNVGKRSLRGDLFALVVRLALPAGRWATVQGMRPRGVRFWNLLLRRTGDRWQVAKLPGISCPWVPLEVQRQLFDSPHCARR